MSHRHYDMEQAEAYILGIPKFTSKNPPESTGAFLEYIGDLSLNIPTIHVAGTNGKGSVCAYLRAGIMKCGLNVGMFTSPHLVSIRERFSFNNTMISEAEFVDCFETVLERLKAFKRDRGCETYHPTFFEFLYFMGMVWYGKKKPDVLILETGLGGRLDATNSIRAPKVCVITEIGLDHMEYLGDTKEKIAAEKAGIIKEGAFLVFHDDHGPAGSVIKERAEKIGVPYIAVSPENIKNLERNPEGIDFSLQYGYDGCADFSLNTKALYQADNAALAYLAACCLSKTGVPIDPDILRGGFKDMLWPGRMEEVKDGLILDGAHNEDGIKAFLESVATDGAEDRRLVFSMVGDKQVETVGEYIKESGLFKSIYICALESPRFAGLDRLRKVFEGSGIETRCFESTADALESAYTGAFSGVVYVVGSLYLVGEVKALLDE